MSSWASRRTFFGGYPKSFDKDEVYVLWFGGVSKNLRRLFNFRCYNVLSVFYCFGVDYLCSRFLECRDRRCQTLGTACPYPKNAYKDNLRQNRKKGYGANSKITFEEAPFFMFISSILSPFPRDGRSWYLPPRGHDDYQSTDWSRTDRCFPRTPRV